MKPTQKPTQADIDEVAALPNPIARSAAMTTLLDGLGHEIAARAWSQLCDTLMKDADL